MTRIHGFTLAAIVINRVIAPSGHLAIESQRPLNLDGQMADGPITRSLARGILAATAGGLLPHAPVCYKQLYAQMDERALEAPQEGGNR
ncbi:MAG: hypothetical protein WCF61_20730, partial [Terriglobales bacterium]